MSQLNWRPHGGYPVLHPGLGQGNVYGHQKTSSGQLSNPLTGQNASNAPTMAPDDFQETKSITLEWKLSSLKTVFDSSRGDVKSRCIKSPVFGDGRWEIYFYGNSGSDYVSLYLSAEPTAEERERGMKLAARNRSYTASMLAKSASNPALAAAVAASKHQSSNIGASSSSQQHQHQSSSSNGGHNGTSPPHPHSSPWVREGSFRFAFEIRSTNKKESPIKMMEAADHVFSSEARNWGWQSFAKRSDVYYNNMAVRHADAFVIACTITHTPVRPAPPPNPLSQKRLMPVELLTAYAALFDDPAYSDVKFIIRSRSPVTGKKQERTIYAIKEILSRRAEYFATMFSSGFAEDKQMTTSDGQSVSRRSSRKFKTDIQQDDSDMESEDSDNLMDMYDSESDEEDGEGIFEDEDEENDGENNEQELTRIDKGQEGEVSDSSQEDHEEDEDDTENHTAHTTINEDPEIGIMRVNTEQGIVASTSSSLSRDNNNNDEMKVDLLPHHGVDTTSGLSASPSRRYPTRQSGRSSLSGGGSANDNIAGTSTMRSASTNMQTVVDGQEKSTKSTKNQKKKDRAGKTDQKTKSTKKVDDQRKKMAKDCVTVVVKDASCSTYKALLYYLYTDDIFFAPLSSIYAHAKDTAEARDRPFSYKSRRQFFDAYCAAVYGSSSPSSDHPLRKDLICSPKAIYKLADKLNIPNLKVRAFEHILQSLSVDTIPYEVFSAFSNQFPEVRRVQIDMMLHYWNEIREGQAMKNVLRLIRMEPDRFPGYEEVWQHLMLNLEYRVNGHAAGVSASPTKEAS